MKRWALMIAAVGLACEAADKPAKEPFSFQSVQVGQLPPGWTATHTGHGTGSVWKVVDDSTAPGVPKVLAQVSAAGNGSFFNLCVADRTSYSDVDVSVAFKATAGAQDQGGGPVWRYQDNDNYYVARMNPLEDNYRVYKVIRGERTQLGSANVQAPTGTWHKLRIVQKGDRIECYLDGKKYLDVTDDTFKDAGKIGLWTKADAQTEFADVKVSGR